MQPLMLGYTRVSTDEQADRRNGLEAQRDTIDSQVARRSWTVEHFADEGVSGKTIGPKLQEALQLLASGQGDGLVVAKLDRLSRSIVNAANIIEAAQAHPVGAYPQRFGLVGGVVVVVDAAMTEASHRQHGIALERHTSLIRLLRNMFGAQRSRQFVATGGPETSLHRCANVPVRFWDGGLRVAVKASG
jgi:hypothetical protein